MGDQKPNSYDRQSSLPIPSYEEAIASRPSSSQSFLGPTEVSNDAERQYLLEQGHRRERAVSPTYVVGEEADEWSLPEEERIRTSTDAEGPNLLPMEMVEFSEDEANNESLSRGSRLSKRITSITYNLSSFKIAIRQYLPLLELTPIRLKPDWIMVGRVLALLLVLVLAYVLFISDILTLHRSNAMGAVIDPESARAIVQQRINRTYIKQNAEFITNFDHVAGTEGSYALGQWVKGSFDSAQLEHVRLERFDVYLNYPRKGGRHVAIVEPPGLQWEAVIEEELAFTNPPRKQTHAFHGHSRAGNVSGPLVYANYGSGEDFARLKASGIDLQGAVILVRYYGSQSDRALKVKAAELAGAVGCVIYSDPAEDGFEKGKPFPGGRFMPSDGVQRGGVSLMNFIVGDVLSPGFASLPGERVRRSKYDNPGLPNIPSIPLAWRDAQILLQALQGHGLKLSGTWVGGVPDVDWWSGDQKSPIVNLMNEQDEVERQPIYNVLGSISGSEQPEKSIIVGNHRDAWCFGATDPGSGTAVFLEVVRIFGELLKSGWRPLRTIEFASWDGEEYNLIGSTEHVEARLENLRRNGFAYLNVDVAVQGRDFRAAASPIFGQALLRVLDRTSDPVRNRTLRSIWDEEESKLEGLGAGSDYVAFQDIAGTSSIDLGFGGPPFPYHSCYDNFQWMSQYGDPGFQYHQLLGQVWALLILEMADRPILPFDLEAYAHTVQDYVRDLEIYASSEVVPQELREAHSAFDLMPLHRAADEFLSNAQEFHQWDRDWSSSVMATGFEGNVMAIKRMSHNTRMANFETNLLDINGGVKDRTQFKHVFFAPQRWSGYNEAYFPTIRDAIEDGDWERAQSEVRKVAGILSYASRKLNH